MKKLSFDDLAGLDAAGADIGALGSALKDDLDLLQIRHDFTQGLADDLGTGAAFTLDHTASFILVARGRTFIANFANLRHMMTSLMNLNDLTKSLSF
jgi:hypothetical protein